MANDPNRDSAVRRAEAELNSALLTQDWDREDRAWAALYALAPEIPGGPRWMEHRDRLGSNR